MGERSVLRRNVKHEAKEERFGTPLARISINELISTIWTGNMRHTLMQQRCFTMNWKMTEPGYTVRYSAGEPICRIFPYRSEYIENFQISILSPEEDPDFMKRVIAWRSDRLARLKSKTTEPASDPKVIWSGDYVKGSDTSGNVYTGPKNVFKCKPVKDIRKK